MELIDDRDGWLISFQAGLVQMIQIDYRLGLLLSDGKASTNIHISTLGRLTWPGGEALLEPEETASLSPILPLANKGVRSVTIRATGHLRVEFAGGHVLEVAPDDQYEAWQLGCSVGARGVMMVCSPGGSVAVFK
jgi:hypothetical protein